MKKFLIGFAIVVLGVILYAVETYVPGASLNEPESEIDKYQEYISQTKEKEEEVYIPGNRDDGDTIEFESERVSIDTGESLPVVTQTKPVSSEAGASTVIVAEPIESIDEKGYHIVRYTDEGFMPPELTVSLRDTVRFINVGDATMWVRVIKKSLSKRYDDYYSVYSTFDQGRSVANGGEFLYTFNKVGKWYYENVSDSDATGIIIVK